MYVLRTQDTNCFHVLNCITICHTCFTKQTKGNDLDTILSIILIRFTIYVTVLKRTRHYKNQQYILLFFYFIIIKPIV